MENQPSLAEKKPASKKKFYAKIILLVILILIIIFFFYSFFQTPQTEPNSIIKSLFSFTYLPMYFIYGFPLSLFHALMLIKLAISILIAGLAFLSLRRKKDNILLLFLSCFFSFAIVNTTFLFFSEKKHQMLVSENFPLIEEEIKDWKVYKNLDFGFELKYPNNWTFRTNTKDNRNNDFSVVFYPLYQENCDLKHVKNNETFLGYGETITLRKEKKYPNNNHYYAYSLHSKRDRKRYKFNKNLEVILFEQRKKNDHYHKQIADIFLGKENIYWEISTSEKKPNNSDTFEKMIFSFRNIDCEKTNCNNIKKGDKRKDSNCDISQKNKEEEAKKNYFIEEIAAMLTCWGSENGKVNKPEESGGNLICTCDNGLCNFSGGLGYYQRFWPSLRMRPEDSYEYTFPEEYFYSLENFLYLKNKEWSFFVKTKTKDSGYEEKFCCTSENNDCRIMKPNEECKAPENQINQNQEQASSSSTLQKETTPDIHDRTTWKEYTNDTIGISFKYPPTYKIEEPTPDSDVIVIRQPTGEEYLQIQLRNAGPPEDFYRPNGAKKVTERKQDGKDSYVYHTYNPIGEGVLEGNYSFKAYVFMIEERKRIDAGYYMDKENGNMFDEIILSIKFEK